MQKLEQYEELKTLNDELVAKLEIYEEQQRKMQADLEQVTKRAASQTSESGSADELQSHVLEWQDMVSDAEGVRDQAREEKAAMALRMAHIEEEREALVTQQQELEEELVQAGGLRAKRVKQKQAASSTRNLQEDFEFDGKQSYQDPNNTLDSSDFADGENMGGLRSVVEELELERNQLQEQILTLEERCQHLEDRLQLQARTESLQNENERLQGQLTNLRSQHSRDTEKHQVLISSLNEQLKGFIDREEILESSLIEKEQTLVETSEKLEQIENLRGSLKEKEVQNKELSDKLLQAEQNVAEVTGKCCTYEKQCSELKTSVADLTHRLNTAREKTQKQDVAIEMLQRDLDQTNDELDKLNSTHLEERAQLIHDLQNCEREIDSLKDVLLERDKEITVLSNSMTEYLDQVLQLKQQIKYKEEEMGGMETALAKAERQAQIIRESQSSDEQTMNTKLACLVEQLKEMEMELSNTREENKAKCSEVEELVKQVHAGNEISQNLRTDIQKLNVTHRTHLAECETQLSSLKEQVTASSRRLQEVHTKSLGEKNKLAAQLEEMNTAYKNLKNLLQEKENKEQSFETELKSFKDECNKLLAEVARKDEELLILSKQLAEQVEHQETVKRGVHEKLETISCLEERLKATQQEAEKTKLKLSQKLQIKETECIQLKEQLEVKSESLLKLETEVKTLENKNDQLQTTVEKKDNEILVQTKLAADLNEKAANVQCVNQNLQCQVNQLTDESEKLKRELTDQESLQSKQQDLVSELQGKISANKVHMSEYEKTVAVMQKEKELTSKTEDIVKLLEQNQNVVAEKLLEKTNLLIKQLQTKYVEEEGQLCENMAVIAQLQTQCQDMQKALQQKEKTLKMQQIEIKQLKDKAEESEVLKSQLNEYLEMISDLQSQLKSMTERSDQLQCSMTEKKALLKIKVDDYVSLKAQFSDLEDTASQLRVQLEQVTTELHTVKDTVKEKESNLKQIEESSLVQREDLILKYKDKQDECESLKDQLSALQETASGLNEHITTQRAEINQLNETIVKTETCILEQTKALQELQEQAEEAKLFKSQLMESTELISQLQSQMQKLTSESKMLDKSAGEKQMALFHLQERYAAQTEQLREISSAVLQKNEEISSLHRLVSEKGDIIKVAENTSSTLKIEVEQLKFELVKNKVSYADLQQKENALAAEIEVQKAQNLEAVKQLNIANQAVEQRELVVRSLNSKYAEQLQNIESLNSEILSLNEKNSNMNKEMELMTQNLQQQLDSAVREKLVLKQDIDRTIAEKEELIKNYSDQLQKKKDELQTCEQLAANLNEARERLKNEKERLQMQVSAKGEEVTRLKLEIQKIEQTLMDSEKEWLADLDRDNQKSSLLTEQLRSLENEMKSKDVKIQALQQDLDNMQGKFAEVSSALKMSSDELTEKNMVVADLSQHIAENQNKLEEMCLVVQKKDSVVQNILSEREKEIKNLQTEKLTSQHDLSEISQSMSEKLLAFEEEKFTLQAAMKQLKLKHQSEVESLKQELDRNTEVLQQKVSEMSEKDKYIQDEKKQVCLLQQQVMNLQEELAISTDKLSSIVKDVHIKESQIRSLTLQVNQQKELLTSINQQLREKDLSVTRVMESASNEIVKHTEEKNQLIVQLENLERKHSCSTKEIESLYQQLEEYKNTLSHSQALVQSKDVEKQGLINEKEQLKVHHDTLAKEKDIMKRKLQAALLVRKELMKKMEELEKKSQVDLNKDKETADLQNIVQELTSQVTQAQTRVKEQESHIELLKQQILQKEADINEFARSLSTKETLVGQLEDNIRHLQTTILEGESSLADALKAFMEKDAVIEALQCSSKENEKSFDNERCALKQEKELLQKKLHAALLARREAIKKAQEKERNLRAESTQQKEEFDKLLIECSQQAEELKTTKEQLTTIQQDYCGKLKEFENNQEVIDALQSQLNCINALLEEKEKSLQEVKMQVEELESKMRSVLHDHDRVNTLKTKMSDMTSELENKANFQKKLEDDSKELSLEIEQVRSELERANIRITEKTEELLILQQTVNIAQQQHQQEKQVLIDECTELQNQLRKTQSDVEYLTVSLEDIKKEKDSQSEAFNNSNKVLLEANNELKEELEKVHSLIAEKSDDCMAMKNTLAEMQHQFELEKVGIKVESEQMESCWKQSQAKAESYKLHLEKIEKEKEDLFCSLEKSRGESVTLQEQLDESNRLKEELAEKVYLLQSSAAQHEEKIFLLLSQTEKLQIILEEKENAIVSLKSSISEKEELLAALELQMQKELHLHEVERGRVKTEIHELHRKAADMSYVSKEQSDVSKSNEQITRKLQAALISRKEALKESKSLKDKIQTLYSEKEELISMSSSLEKSLADMKNQQEDLKVSIATLNDEKEILISEVDKILSDNHSLSAACESLKHTIENITQQKQAFSCQLESLKDSETEELSEWKSKHKELKQEYESLLQAYENISSEMGKMRQLVETTRKEKQEVLSKRCKLETEKEELEKQLNEAEEEQEKQKEKMRTFAKLKQQKIQELEEENEIKNDRLEMAEKQQGAVEELALKKTELEEENKALQETCEELRKKLNEFQSEKSNLLSDVEANRSILEKLQVETKAHQSDLQIKINEALSLKDLFAAELESQKADIVAKVEVIKTLQQEKFSLSEQVTELERQHKVELNKRENTVAKLDSEMNSNLQETISLNEKVRILEDDKSLLQEELENMQEISEKVKNENEYLETVLLKSAERIDLLTDTVSTLRIQNNLLSTQLSEIKEEKLGLIRQKEGQQVKLVKDFEEKLRAAQRGNEGSKSVTKELQELLREKHQEINQMQKDCIQYQELILDLERSVKLSQSERDAIEKELKNVNEKVPKLVDKIGNLCKEITSYKDLLREARKQLERVQSENAWLKEELVQKEAQAELQKMDRKKEMEQVNEQQKALYKNELMKTEERINILQREKERKREEVLQLKIKIESRDLLTKKLEKEANTNLAKLAAFSHTISSLQNNGDSVADETNQWELRFQEVIEDKEKQLLDQKLALLQLTEEMKIKDMQIHEFQHKSSNLEVAFDETDSRYKAPCIDFQNEKALLIATSRELSQNFEMLKERFEEQKDHVQKLEDDKKALQHQLSDSGDCAVHMKAELLTLEKRFTDTDSELQLSQSFSDTLQVVLEKQEATAKQLKSLLINKDTEISMLLSSKCGEMSGYIAEIQNRNRIQIASYEEHVNALYDEKEKTNKAFRGLENRIKNLQVKYEKSVQEKEQMAAKMGNLNALTSSQSERDGLLSEYKVLEERFRSVANEKAILSQEEETESKTLKQEIKTLLYQMDDLNSENAMLKAQLIRYREDFNQVLSLKDNQLKQLLKKQLDSIKNLEDGKAVVEKQYQDALRDLRPQNKICARQWRISDNTYNQLMVQIEDLRKAVADGDTEIKRFSSEKETYTRQMTAFSKSMASLQDDRDRLLQELGGSKRVYESRQGAASTASSVNHATDLNVLRNNCAALQAENGRLLEEITSLRSEHMELPQIKSKAAELEKALQQADAFRLQTEQDVGAYQTELAELRTEKNLLLTESRSLKEQYLIMVADKDREISEMQKLYPEESRKSSGIYPIQTECVTLVANEDSSDQVKLLLTERIQLQSDLQRCLQEVQQRDLRFQQLNSKMMQTIEEKTNLTTQLKAVAQTLRDTQLHHNELQNRCYWLERQQTRPIQASVQGHVQGKAATEVPPGAPQERASAVVDIESLEVVELRKSFDASSSRSAVREYSIQLESDDEREALIIDPTEHVVVRKMKGGALSVKRWLRGRSLYCSKLLTSRAKSRYLFLTYLLALHVAVFMCLTGVL
ncbi:UNVERIFIED_CONTAM: hypothetical protein FKN15_026924 [Acipenser sinensis]